MDQISPQVMNKLVFAVLMHGLPDNQTNLALTVLTDALGHSNNQIRELSVVALSELQVPGTKRVSALALALRDGSAKIRRRAARAIGDQGAAAQAAIPALVAGLRDSDASVRRDCAGALGRLGPAAHVASSSILMLLSENDARTRAVVAVAMKRIGKACLSTLLHGIKSTNPEVKARCLMLASSIAPDDSRVLVALHDAQRDENAIVREYVDEAMLAVTTPPPSGPPRMSGSKSKPDFAIPALAVA
jgi:HEAT repeat protein